MELQEHQEPPDRTELMELEDQEDTMEDRVLPDLMGSMALMVGMEPQVPRDQEDSTDALEPKVLLEPQDVMVSMASMASMDSMEPQELQDPTDVMVPRDQEDSEDKLDLTVSMDSMVLQEPQELMDVMVLMA